MILKNKANLANSQIDAMQAITMVYGDFNGRRLWKNKANLSLREQTQFVLFTAGNAELAEFLICKDLSQCNRLQNKEIQYLAGVLRNTIYEIRNTRSEVVIEVFRPAVVAVVGCLIFGLSVDSDALDALGLFCAAVDSYQDCIHFHIAGGYLKRERHLRSKRLQDALDAPAEHGIVRTGHPDIGYIRGAFGHNSLVGGHDVSMSAETQADPAVEMIAHSDFFAGGFGVKVNDYDVGLLFELRQDSVNSIIRAVAGLHKKTPYQSDDCYGRPLAGLVKGEALARCALGKICRPNDILCRFQCRDYVSFAVSVVA